jgi:thiosulfate/3-mercaptopyruvate sulfurtransferase
MNEGYAHPEVLVDEAWLERHLQDPAVRIVEVDLSPAAYNEGHISAAVLWNVYRDLKDANYELVGREALQELVRRSGIRRDSVVVFYGYAPAMGFWLMKLFGHADVRILNTARSTWQGDGRPWTASKPEPPMTDYQLPPEDGRVRAEQAAVEQAIGAANCTILDVRTESEYRGERFWPSGSMEEGGRAGHIPSATFIPVDGVLDERGAFRSAKELRQHFAGLDLAADEDVIPYCTIGGRASTAWFILTQLLGHEKARVYDGSWAEWGRMRSTPVEVS